MLKDLTQHFMRRVLLNSAMKKVVAGSAFALLLVCIILALPNVFLPKRWLDIRPGQDRTAVHAALGVPDADFTEWKGFDGWHNSFGVGASVIVVRYDEARFKVSSVNIKTEWGTSHLDWVQEYKSRLPVAGK